jgi:hypothetical protein
MCSADEGDVVIAIELFDACLTKEVARSSWRDRPALDLIRIRPHQIAHGSIVRYFLSPIDSFDIIDVGCVGRQPPVHAKDLVIDQGCKR